MFSYAWGTELLEAQRGVGWAGREGRQIWASRISSADNVMGPPLKGEKFLSWQHIEVYVYFEVYANGQEYAGESEGFGWSIKSKSRHACMLRG